MPLKLDCLKAVELTLCLGIKIIPNIWYNKITTSTKTKKQDTQNQFSNTIKKLQGLASLHETNITKNYNISAHKVFQFLLFFYISVKEFIPVPEFQT